MATSFTGGLSGSESRNGRRNLKGDMREQSILEGAYEILRSEPLRNVSIDDLAKRAGLSRSSFYFYFESKWQVLSALLSSVTADVFTASVMIFERPPGISPEAAIEYAVSQVIVVWEKHGHIFREVGDAAAAEPSLQAQWDKILGRFVDAAAAAIERDRAAGVAIAGPPARSLAAALIWMGERNLGLMSMRSENAIRTEEMVETVTTVWLRSVFGLDWRGGDLKSS
ncbi:TetR/AcrR family transcriptional regulator [Rhodococcus qingshengii]|uniref:TetR/AcrR family transcriptional regulator n=1 Tax=Rhodococcus qingshengii TaxID=334542 RepID=A0AAW6LS26_RHOSG|nr:TetR/AcrR family transcriptional regulator [Rhodococcus qingshengii]MDE8649299.1 TetR/AcrR family transcriptional regulator [Rhodococcus qingshengii]